MEKDDDIKGNNNSYDFGARMYDPRIGRWFSPDAKVYEYASPYNFVLNSPISSIDKEGNDVYLIIWFTKDGKIGHVGIVVANYKEKKLEVEENGECIKRLARVPDGTVTYYDFWPKNGSGKSNFDKDTEGKVNKVKLNIVDIFSEKMELPAPFGKTKEFPNDLGSGTMKQPDGIVKINSEYNVDKLIHNKLSEIFNSQNTKNKPKYNGVSNNCTTFAVCGLIEIDELSNVKGLEHLKTDGSKLLRIEPVDVNSSTPNFLFKEIMKIIKENPKLGEILKNNGVGGDFINEVTKERLKDETPNN